MTDKNKEPYHLKSKWTIEQGEDIIAHFSLDLNAKIIFLGLDTYEKIDAIRRINGILSG